MSSPPAPPHSAMSDADYQRLAGEALARVEAAVDRWLEDDVIDIDAQRSGGLLELTLPDRSKLVINLQPPLHELWLAAKARGYHFRWSGQGWVDREGLEFFDVLSQAVSAQAGRPLQF